jgi:hypothetical protein
MVLLRVEVRRKFRPSWRGFYEVKESRKPNAGSREKDRSWRYCVCQVEGTTGAKLNYGGRVEQGLTVARMSLVGGRKYKFVVRAQ